MKKNKKINPSSCLCNLELKIYTNERIFFWNKDLTHRAEGSVKEVII